ncbi:MAG TPA: thioredoxin family protein, partial [Sediminispirochaeta sp.]|nr:thioredoxin family protein [Sediminispirochaeta sp.]
MSTTVRAAFALLLWLSITALSSMDLDLLTTPILFIGNNAYQGKYAIEHFVEQELHYLLDRGEFRPFDRATARPITPKETSNGADFSGLGEEGKLLFFWGIGCSRCAAAEPLLDELERRYPELRVERYEVLESTEHHDFFRKALEYYKVDSTSIPQFYFGQIRWLGVDDTLARQLEQAAASYAATGEMPDEEMFS